MKKFKISHPDVRRMMFINGFAASGMFDMIVYSDLDAFYLKSPLTELKHELNNNYSAAFSRNEYNSSTSICNGFFAIFDMKLPTYWVNLGIFSQNEINFWLRDKFFKKFNISIDDSNFFIRVLNVPITEMMSHHKNISIKLLEEPDYFRGACRDPIKERMKIFHCHSAYFRLDPKEKEMQMAHRLSPLKYSFIKLLVKGSLLPQNNGENTDRNIVNISYGRRYYDTIKPQQGYPSTYSISLRVHKLDTTEKTQLKLRKLFSEEKSWQALYSMFYPNN
jgi:hypothetical protein